MLRKIFYITAVSVSILVVAYLMQPLRTGQGIDQSLKYELEDDWPNLPDTPKTGEPTGLDMDADDNLVIFHRGGREWPLLGDMPSEPISANTILVVDKETGRLIRSWGAGMFVMPHGLSIDRDNNVWLTDVGLQQVFKFSADGRKLLTLGEPGVAGSDSLHFDKPTAVAVADDGCIYVSDGYGNSRIIKFNAEGKYLMQWGSKGEGQGEFDIPHDIAIGADGLVYVADRENSRVQVFDQTGRFQKEYKRSAFGAIFGISFNASGRRLFAVDDVSFLKLKHRGSDALVFDEQGRVAARFGRSGSYEGPLTWYHDIAVDKEENIYVADILNNRIWKFRKAVAEKNNATTAPH